MPLAGDGLEALGARLCELLRFAGLPGIDAGGELLAGGIPLRAGRFQAHVGIDAEREPVLPATGAILPEREHPLPHRDPRQDGVDQVGRLGGHAPAAAARAEAAALAREGHEPLEGAIAAAHAGEAAGEDPAAEEVTELALDEVGEPGALPTGDRGLEERLEVIADEAVEDAAFGTAGLIAAGTHGDRTSEGRAGLGLRSGAALPVRARRGRNVRPQRTVSPRAHVHEGWGGRRRGKGGLVLTAGPRWIAFQELID